jgi:hypothetical protein
LAVSIFFSSATDSLDSFFGTAVSTRADFDSEIDFVDAASDLFDGMETAPEAFSFSSGTDGSTFSDCDSSVTFSFSSDGDISFGWDRRLEDREIFSSRELSSSVLLAFKAASSSACSCARANKICFTCSCRDVC